MCNIKKITALCAVLYVFVSCDTAGHRQNERDKAMHEQASVVYAAVSEECNAERLAVAEYVSSLSVQEQVRQLFIENLEGSDTFTPVEWTIGQEKRSAVIPGGYLFFSYNIADTPEKIISFTDSINAYCVSRNMIPPYLALDQEGGEVSRLHGVAGPVPSSRKIAEKLSVAEAFRLYSLQAVQMKALGFTMDLAPVAEVCTDTNRAFLSGRSFGSADAVIAYGTAAVNAFQNNGVASVLKHFPGNTNTDPHTGLPEIELSAAEIENTVMQPFSRLIAHNPAGVLMSHARTAAFDPETPACLSPVWVTDKLRRQAGFGGLIFSDDIFMGALADNGYPPEKAAVLAVEAGVDIIMISEKRINGAASVLSARAASDPRFAEKIRSAAERVLYFKIQYGILHLEKKDGSWQVVIPPLNGTSYAPSVQDRLCRFYTAKNENIVLYREKFMNTGGSYAQK
jgi:beta-N-acetylhexosaminidase